MDRLWTPWRFDYIRRIDPAATGSECVFCSILADAHDAENLVLYRGPSAFIVLNLFPYTAGHLLIVASRHVSRLADLDQGERATGESRPGFVPSGRSKFVFATHRSESRFLLEIFATAP